MTNPNTPHLAPSSGVPTLDQLLAGGLAAGDNIVWVADRHGDLDPLISAFLAAGPAGDRVGRPRYLRLAPDRGPEPPPGVDVVGMPADDAFPDPEALEALVLAPEVTAGSRIVVTSLDDLVLRWGAETAVRFYTSTCPQLFDRGAVAYWTATRELIGTAVLDGVARIAQCVFELRSDRLRIRKAEGRPQRVQGAVAEYRMEAGVPVVSREHAVGRVGEGLRRLRTDRGLTQTQLAGIAGVTPAAISQTESGRRGLSLDTLLPLCEALGVGIDDLVGLGRRPSPWLGRRDGGVGDGRATVPLFDDPGAGVRVHLVQLGPGEDGRPPVTHKGPELVLAATGLVLIDLGETTPVLRAGDGVMVTEVPVLRWTNLHTGPSTLFWLALGTRYEGAVEEGPPHGP